MGRTSSSSRLFAIDWIRLEDNRLFTGDGTRNEDYFAFGAEVLAVADGTVVFVRDGMPEDTPNEPPTTLHQPLDYGGNEVVLEIAPGVYAFYAHLQPGSIRVQIGETVTTGQVLGLLGNTGNSTAPHLHFQLADGPDVLTATSLPFVIDHDRWPDRSRRRARPATSGWWARPSPKRRHYRST